MLDDKPKPSQSTEVCVCVCVCIVLWFGNCIVFNVTWSEPRAGASAVKLASEQAGDCINSRWPGLRRGENVRPRCVAQATSKLGSVRDRQLAAPNETRQQSSNCCLKITLDARCGVVCHSSTCCRSIPVMLILANECRIALSEFHCYSAFPHHIPITRHAMLFSQLAPPLIAIDSFFSNVSDAIVYAVNFVLLHPCGCPEESSLLSCFNICNLLSRLDTVMFQRAYFVSVNYWIIRRPHHYIQLKREWGKLSNVLPEPRGPHTSALIWVISVSLALRHTPLRIHWYAASASLTPSYRC